VWFRHTKSRPTQFYCTNTTYPGKGFAALAGISHQEAVQRLLQRWLDAHRRELMARSFEQRRAFILRNEARLRGKTDVGQVVRDLAGYKDPRWGLVLLTPEGAKEAFDGN
jgi:hypothetical protein